MVTALQALDVDVQLMILDLVWKARCLYLFTEYMLTNKYS